MTFTEAQWQTQRRTELVAHAEFLHAWQAHIGYSTDRPVQDIDQSMNGMRTLFEGGFIWYPDCSGAVEWIFKWSGMRSPTGFPYGGWGSQAMWQYLTVRFDDPAHAHAGTLGVYGVQGDQHVVMVVAPGATREETRVFSHGEANECRLLALADEDTAHEGQPFTFLSILPLFPPLPSAKTRGAHR